MTKKKSRRAKPQRKQKPTIDQKQLKRAINTIRKSRASHHDWLAYYDKYPGKERVHAKSVGSVKFHQDVIKGYDFVIEFLQSLGKQGAK